MKKLLLIAAVAAIGTLTFAGNRNPPSFSGRPFEIGGAPNNGTNEIQTLTFGAGTTTGNFKLTFQGETTGNIAWTATDATLVTNIDTALEALSGIGTSGVATAAGTVSSGIGTVTVTFSGANVAKLNVGIISVATQTTGGTLSVAESTAGVEADGRDSGIGAIAIDSTNGAMYQNLAAAPNPVWSRFNQADGGTITATASSGAATLSKLSGTVTSEALTTAAAAAYTLTLTNTKIAATSRVLASVANGTNTQGIPVVSTVVPGSGSVVIKVFNLHATEALNGTIKINFLVLP